MIHQLAVEADEMSSLVHKKANKPWIGIAMEAKPRQVMAFLVGDRSRKSAKHLWAKIPQAYCQHATFYTDQYVVYAGVIPAAQHQTIGKLARKTNHIERFNNTLRQRVSRLVHEALSFSKKRAHHVGAIKLFICSYNLTRAAAQSEHYLAITTENRASPMASLRAQDHPGTYAERLALEGGNSFANSIRPFLKPSSIGLMACSLVMLLSLSADLGELYSLNFADSNVQFCGHGSRIHQAGMRSGVAPDYSAPTPRPPQRSLWIRTDGQDAFLS
jgi:IS1 family transposase